MCGLLDSLGLPYACLCYFVYFGVLYPSDIILQMSESGVSCVFPKQRICHLQHRKTTQILLPRGQLLPPVVPLVLNRNHNVTEQIEVPSRHLRLLLLTRLHHTGLSRSNLDELEGAQLVALTDALEAHGLVHAVVAVVYLWGRVERVVVLVCAAVEGILGVDGNVESIDALYDMINTHMRF